MSTKSVADLQVVLSEISKRPAGSHVSFRKRTRKITVGKIEIRKEGR
jgi:hypothetical protein